MTTLTQKQKAKGRTLEEFGELAPAERKLLEHCRAGTAAPISNDRPKDATAENTVRAEFVRFLALGGDNEAPVHEHGVSLKGAWIEGRLQMRSAIVPSDFILSSCHFSKAPVFQSARIEGTLALEKSHVPGFEGDRLVCEGGLHLRHGFTAAGIVRLLGARIEGNLDCSNAKFYGEVVTDNNGNIKDRHALVADGIVVEGGVFLCDGFAATGEVRLPGARIEGNLSCSGAAFDGKVNERKDGKKRGYALGADGMKVDGVFFFRELRNPVDDISLAASHVGHLADDEESWGKALVLDGFTYGSITSGSPTGAAARLAWLDKQRAGDAGLDGKSKKFKPQPWRQLVKVMREMGHAEDARQVAIALEHRLRGANLIGQAPAHWGKLHSMIYSYRPCRALAALAIHRFRLSSGALAGLDVGCMDRLFRILLARCLEWGV